MGQKFNASLKESASTVGPVDQLCRGKCGSVGGFAFCIAVSGGGNSWKPDGSGAGRQTVTCSS